VACSTDDVIKLNRLFRKYVGSGAPSAKKLAEVVRRETAAAEAGRIKVTAGLLRELRADRAVAGRLKNVCSGSPFAGYSKRNRRTRRVRRAAKRY